MLHISNNFFETEIITAAMQKNNIPILKKDSGLSGLQSITRGNSGSGTEIYVSEEDLAKALEILKGIGIE